MASRQRRFALAALASFLIFLPGLQSQNAGPAPLYVTLNYNGGACTQNGSTGTLEVAAGQDVWFQTAAAVSQFQVGFATCAFSSCPVTSPQGKPVDAGVTVSTGTFYYSTISIGNQTCNNGPGSFGLHIKPGPLRKSP